MICTRISPASVMVTWSQLIYLTILALTFCHSAVFGHRRNIGGSTDSILEIINTKEVERILAARRQNMTRQHERRYLAQNDLDEDVPDQSPQAVLYEQNEMTQDFHIDKHPRNRNERVGLDILMHHFNRTANNEYREPDFRNELMGFNGQRLLKSSKNALVVTRKEYLKKDWCKTEPLVQRIREDGCLTRTVINRFCYGQCNSFYIPKNPKRRRGRLGMMPELEREDRDQNGPAFKSCAFCKPKKFTWVTVTLRCPSLVPPYRKKRVQRIKQCKCVAVNVN